MEGSPSSRGREPIGVVAAELGGVSSVAVRDGAPWERSPLTINLLAECHFREQRIDERLVRIMSYDPRRRDCRHA